jgi:hypothetical protein
MSYISNESKITEDVLPIALALYAMRDDVEWHKWDENGTWRFINGTDKRHPILSATCSFSDAVAAFLLGEIGDYFGEWVNATLDQVSSCNNGKIVRVFDTDIKPRLIVAISTDELDILVNNGFNPVGYKP